MLIGRCAVSGFWADSLLHARGAGGLHERGRRFWPRKMRLAVTDTEARRAEGRQADWFAGGGYVSAPMAHFDVALLSSRRLRPKGEGRPARASRRRCLMARHFHAGASPPRTSSAARHRAAPLSCSLRGRVSRVRPPRRAWSRRPIDGAAFRRSRDTGPPLTLAILPMPGRSSPITLLPAMASRRSSLGRCCFCQVMIYGRLAAQHLSRERVSIIRADDYATRAPVDCSRLPPV